MTQDDFESGLLVGSGAGNRWSSIHNQGQVNNFTLEVKTGGRVGNAAVMTDSSASNGFGGLSLRKDLDGGTSDVWVRAWVQYAPQNTIQVSLMSFYTDLAPLPGVASDFSNRLQANNLAQSALFQASDGTNLREGAPLTSWDAGWHAVEISMLGVKQPTGSTTLRVDGEVRETFNSDWTNRPLTAFGLGPEYMAEEWIGEIRYDNVALTRGGPPPARLVWVQAVPPTAGCVPVRVELHDDIGGALAKAVRTTHLSLSATAGARFFSSATCAAAITSVDVAAGEVFASVWLQAPQGAVTLTASDQAADLATASQALTFQ